ncbi:hypothetical protein HNQ50_000915 [Silvimonas terrae]|uniref:DUF2946 family protein n=1 Tax=Silvimonas terrae TaxID=300266 RepID=A0A840RCU1_9NEIS|nr:DUF2946 family protein [Silvimonas terrae]MBB5190193.1 hypothetical protein [Silvimonas terrae]
MYRQLHLLRLALIAALLAMLAAVLVPAVMQMLNPVAVELTTTDSQRERSVCSQQQHQHAGESGQGQSCPMCSVFCHAPTLPGLPQVTFMAPRNSGWPSLPPAPARLIVAALTSPPARAPPANR